MDNTESALMGCLLLDPISFAQTKESLDVNDLYYINNQNIYKAFEHYYSLGINPDIFLLSDYFKEKGLRIELSDLDELQNNAGISLNIPYYCKAIKEKALKRKFLNTLKGLLESNTADFLCKDLISGLMKDLITLNKDSSDKYTIDQALNEFMEQYQRLDSFVSSGFSQLDIVFNGGLPKHSFNVVAAQSGTGKTVFSCNQVVNKINKGEKLLYINLEVPIPDLLEIIIPQVTPYNYEDLVQKKYPSDSVVGTIKELQLKGLYFAKNCYAIEQIIAQIDLHRINYGVDTVFIDHLQLIKNASNYEQYTEITKELKRYALKYEVCITALSQLNDKHEDRADKEPTKGSLRGGANLFQDADTVIFLYRLDQEEKTVYLKVAKNRKGGDGRALYYEILFDVQKRKVKLMELKGKPYAKKKNTDD